MRFFSRSAFVIAALATISACSSDGDDEPTPPTTIDDGTGDGTDAGTDGSDEGEDTDPSDDDSGSPDSGDDEGDGGTGGGEKVTAALAVAIPMPVMRTAAASLSILPRSAMRSMTRRSPAPSRSMAIATT